LVNDINSVYREGSRSSLARVFCSLSCSLSNGTLLEKAKLAREITDGKNEIPHKFYEIREGFYVFLH